MWGAVITNKRAAMPTPTRLQIKPRTFFFKHTAAHLALHSFPTRRSSDLLFPLGPGRLQFTDQAGAGVPFVRCPLSIDRKSTRLNSSHPSISYAVFCLKKKIHELWVDMLICRFYLKAYLRLPHLVSCTSLV